jgi:hypothetical protein
MEHSDMRDSAPTNDPMRDSAASPDGASDMRDGSQGIGDRARDMAGTAREKLVDVGSTVRERAGTMKNSLADAIDSGADKLRQRGVGGMGNPALAGESGASSVAMSDGRVAQVSDKVATGMHATADWLRDADLDGLKQRLETQVKEHPGRTLLIAVGVGYLLGKALRK